MAINPKLAELIEKYRCHPDFLGREIADPNHAGAVGDTMLPIAARKGAIEDIELLLAFGAKVNAAGDLGNTPLHGAAMTGQIATVQRLLECGADPNCRNEFHQTPADLAELGGRPRIVELLRGHRDV
jgi:uncharacterized protein